ncbi:hypothetical protein LOCC1_G003027 [Lachnellula occidentalis]|uniref:Uncharacterized protein n=1 Tax=Lachnellula occidentalis TaxID=215460 RepID=A0A8H8S3U1_9HELO|nr:hypothetical protein LOCC1_G003027 [Lachnellula occidentalis]
MPRTGPLALSPALPSELLTYILSQSAKPTTLIICQPRTAFLSSLRDSITTHDDPSDNEGRSPPEHPLLVPTLHQIATSRHVKLVFIPTVSHLRAYMAVFPKEDHGQEGEKKTPLLVVYGLVELHRDTSEWSAQGLGNSVAGLVEAGWRGRLEVVVVERQVDDGGVSLNLDDLEMGEGEGRDARRVWEQRMPMLNGSVRRAGMESEDGGWSGRTVEVGRILGRWFRFRKGNWELEE